MIKMTKKYSIIVLIAIILLIIFIYKISSSSTAKSAPPKPNVMVNTLQKKLMEQSETLTGDIAPEQQAIIYNKVNGNIEKLYVDIGDKVKQGQILALIDTTIYSQNVRQAKAALLQAEANSQNAKLSYERNKVLVDKKMISQQDLDNSKAALDISLAQKEAATAALNNAATQLTYCKITAPFSGTITKRNFDAGAYLTTASSSATSGLFTLMNTSKLKINVSVPERSVTYLSEVKEISITADADNQKKYSGKISKTSQALDLSTRTMNVEIAITNPDASLKPGMFATIRFVIIKKDDSNTLPTQAILSDDNGEFVFVLNADTTVAKKYVKVGIRSEEISEIISGISETEKVVCVGQTLIKDKLKVRVTEK